MDDILLLDATERYLKGEMTPQEKNFFEELRKNTPEIDQLVVEHSMFMHQMEAYGSTKNFKHLLHEAHNNLLQVGEINEGNITPRGKVMQLWHKYKRVTAIAATIACVTALFISSLVSYFTPVSNKNDRQLRELGMVVEQLKRNDRVQSNQISVLKSKVPVDQKPTGGGTSFLIDAKGYLVTNAHVVRGSSTIVITNIKGQEFKARIVMQDDDKDIAILKIDDEDYKPMSALPYSIRKSNTNLGAPIFTLGFPKDDIVYNEGYLSSPNGYNGDTVSIQIAVSANPGNSGGPVLNKHGEIIGILSTSQEQAEGVVFAIKSKNIYQAIEELKKSDTSFGKIKLPTTTTLRGMDREQQIKLVEDYVFLVKGFTR